MSTGTHTTQRGVVVWEWQDDFGEWIPYDPLSCQEIEQEYKTTRNGSVQLKSNPRMSVYTIDLARSTQMNIKTGLQRSIQRNVLPASSATARGILWQWEVSKSQKNWVSYSTTINEYIQEQYRQGNMRFKFPSKFSLPYSVDFASRTQENVKTGTKRNIQRVTLQHLYPKDTISSTHVPSSQQNGSSNQPYKTTYNSSYGASRPLPQPKTSTNPLPYTQPHATTHNFTPSHGIPLISHVITNQPTPYQNTLYPNLANPTPFVQNHIHRSLPSSTAAAPGSFIPSFLQNSNTNTSFAAAVNPGLQSTGGITNSSISNVAPQTNRVFVPPCPRGGIPCDVQGATKSTVPITDVLKNFTKKIDVDSSSTEQCAICQSSLAGESGFGNSKETQELNLCKHVFHTECIEASYEHSVKNGCIVCPACSKMHGIKTGTQPPGSMSYCTMPQSLPGYEGYSTIQIAYNIQSGIQSSEHPHPGKPYRPVGFPRIAFLPDNDPGRKVLLLLIEAWKRRLIFMVGQSSTTGMDDCVIWTGIHHKTEMRSYRGHGYPDDTYLDRVTAELEAEGVV